MTLFIFYLALALGVSFICSLAEAALLSISPAFVAALASRGGRPGKMLDRMKRQIDRPLAAILTLNTVAHTVGAAGVGAQSLIVFSNIPIAVTSGVLTLLILVASEIIPKTIGAVYAQTLIAPMTYVIQGMIVITWPLLLALNIIAALLRGRGPGAVLTREQLTALAELARTEGALSPAEAKIMHNMLRLSEEQIETVMTPRNVAFFVQGDTTIEEMVQLDRFRQFSRAPVYGESPDDVIGLALKVDVFDALHRGERDKPVRELVRPIQAIPETATLLAALEEFGRHGEHLMLVVDEYGGTAGLVTLEDVVETIIGVEIVDETDVVADLRRLAARSRRSRT